jgi:hypothetical protein
LGTNLGIKFFVLLLLVSLSGMAAKAFSGEDSRAHSKLFPDTIPVQRPASQTVQIPDSLQPAFSPEFLLQSQDTIPGELNDTVIALTVEPPRQRGSGTILDARVDYSAVDSIYFNVRERKVFLYGNADLKYGEIHLEAGYVEIDFRRNELYASGLPDSAGVMQGIPVFTEGPQSFQSKEMWYNFETKRGRTLGVFTEEADGYLHGDIVKIQPSRIIHVQDGKYTTCDDPEPHFHIGFRRAKIIPEDKIITSLAFLVIEGVPTPLVVPFGFFPNKRGQASGILMPSYGETANRGFYLENGGFYWGINDYVDLSLRGDIFTRGSWAARLGSTYRVRYRYSGSMNLSYAINILGEENLPGYERSRDFRVVWNHSQDPKARPNSVFRANVNAGSSQASRFNPVSDQDYLSNTFSSNVSYSASWAGRYNFSANFRHSQNTINRSVDLSLPEIAFSVNRLHPFRRKDSRGEAKWYENITMNYTMNARNDLRTVDSLLFERETWSKFRNGMSHSIPISHSFRILRHFNLSNSINYNERWYLSTIEKNWDPQAMYVQGGDTLFGREVIDTISGFKAARDFNFSTSLNTRFYGMVQFRRGPVRAFRHVVSPNLSFSYRPDFGSPFWGYYQTYYNPVQDREVKYSIFEQGIYQGPQPNRSGSINFSLANNLEMKVRNRRDTTARGERKIALFDNLSINGGYDIARDSLKFSDIRVSARTRLFNNFDITYSSGWTVYDTDSIGRSVNRFLWETDRKLLKLNNTNWSLGFNYSLSSKTRPSGAGAGQMRGMEGPDQGGPEGFPGLGEDDEGQIPAAEMVQLAPGVIDYSVPWSLRFGYTFNYNSRYNYRDEQFDRNYVQSLNVSGDMQLTPKWRLGFRSGYDFERKEITYTSVDIYRDLHCWEMTLNWIPFGFRKSYNLTIRVKSQMLQDLKLSRRTHHLDRAFQTF